MDQSLRPKGPRIELSTARHLFVEYRDEIREAFCRAVQQALLEHKRAGNPIGFQKTIRSSGSNRNKLRSTP